MCRKAHLRLLMSQLGWYIEVCLPVDAGISLRADRGSKSCIGRARLMQYLLIVPSVLQSGTSNEACVDLLDLNETASLSIMLKYGIDTYNLFEESVNQTQFSKCFNFKVPPAQSNPLAFIEFSIKGSSPSFYERRSVAIRNISTATFIQTDKPTYKPNDKVMFRVLTLDTDFRPVKKVYQLIYMEDPQGNRIAQWLNQSSDSGILQLELKIVQGAMLGTYNIKVQDTRSDADSPFETSSSVSSFNVKEYVLPKYKVTLNAPQRVSPYDEEFKVDVCADYTYGQPVQGTVQFRVCRHRFYQPGCDRNSNGVCEAVNAKLGNNGCVSRNISTKMFQLYRNPSNTRFFFSSLNVEGVVTEDGTGVQASSSSYIPVYQARKGLMFVNVGQYYYRGIPYTGKVKLTDENEKPLANGVILLTLNGEVVANLTTDKDGIAPFSIKTSDRFESRYKLVATLTFYPRQCDNSWPDGIDTQATQYIQRFYSRTDSYLEIEPVTKELKCGQTESINVRYILKGDKDEAGKNTEVTFYYILMAKGKIVGSGNQKIRVNVGQYGTFAFQIEINEKLAPRPNLVVYTIYNELVADSTFLQVEKCFRNKVSLQFSEKQALPGSPVSLEVKAAGNSICALRAVDKSVLLESYEAGLTPDSVYYKFPYLELYGYYYNGLNLDDYPELPCIEPKDTFFNGMYHIPVNVTNDGSVYDIFKNLGLKVFIDSTIQKPVVCQSDWECKKKSQTEEIEENARIAYGGAASAKGIIETVRTSFPETWIWKLMSVSSSGSSTQHYTTPDTITEWEANAFCVEDKVGFGLSKTASLVVYQQFFVDIKSPYSVVRGEDFLLISVVFSYMKGCTEIRAALQDSPDFKVKNSPQDNSYTKICANERKTYTWTIAPHKLGTINITVTAEAKATEETQGRRDTIIKPLLVEPEGIKKELAQSILISANGTTAHELISLDLPVDLVQGSASAYVFVVGDILGTAMRNTESFLRIPDGCGEQNIAMFGSNLIVLDYLSKTGQLTEAKRSRLIGDLTSGYQKQLSYRLSDGSFSTFGSRDSEGNIWLTAGVLRRFAEARPYIFIDVNVVNQGLIWIASKQESDGSFPSEGQIFNNVLKDGSDAKVVLTSFVTASLLRAGLDVAFPVVKNALSYLNAASEKGVHNIYEKALLAYMYGIAGNREKQKTILEDLKRQAVRTGNLVHWEREKKPGTENYPSFYSRASSAEIEITGYIALALLDQPNLSRKGLTFIYQIISWLVKQQNPNGGFSSTQDTLVALQALAEYGVLTYVENAQNTVKVSSGGSFSKVFQVNRENSVLLQQADLPHIPGNYSVEVNGIGNVYIQIALQYNVHLPALNSGFDLTLQTTKASCTGNHLPRFELVMTARFTGERNTSNMVIIDVKMLSGYVPVQASLDKLQDKVMRIETRNDHVFLYLAGVPKKRVTLEITLEQTFPVTNSKPAPVMIYDYYETDAFALAQYNTPCHQA
ncbi:ovostatin-like [Tiliqua scincoides]|uniref:ovostatin-like n=1 Tax=Tiliqua scincoides TaxID=71010 RepID=UPI0034629704